MVKTYDDGHGGELHLPFWLKPETVEKLAEAIKILAFKNRQDWFRAMVYMTIQNHRNMIGAKEKPPEPGAYEADFKGKKVMIWIKKELAQELDEALRFFGYKSRQHWFGAVARTTINQAAERNWKGMRQ